MPTPKQSSHEPLRFTEEGLGSDLWGFGGWKHQEASKSLGCLAAENRSSRGITKNIKKIKNNKKCDTFTAAIILSF